MYVYVFIYVFIFNFRSHDICLEVTGEYLAPGQCKNGLCNFSPFTRSPCGCDHNFVRCLKKAKTKIANTLGTEVDISWYEFYNIYIKKRILLSYLVLDTFLFSLRTCVLQHCWPNLLQVWSPNKEMRWIYRRDSHE